MRFVWIAGFLLVVGAGRTALGQPEQGCYYAQIVDGAGSTSYVLPFAYLAGDSREVQVCLYRCDQVWDPTPCPCLTPPVDLFPPNWPDVRCAYDWASGFEVIDLATMSPVAGGGQCFTFSPGSLPPGNYRLQGSYVCNNQPDELTCLEFSVFTDAYIVAEYRDAGCECSNESDPNDSNSATDWVQALPNGTSPIGTCLEQEWRIRVIVDPPTVHLDGHPEHQYAGSATWTWSEGPYPLQDPYPDYWFVDSCMELYPGWDCPRSLLPANGLFTGVRARFPLGADEFYTTNSVSFQRVGANIRVWRGSSIINECDELSGAPLVVCPCDPTSKDCFTVNLVAFGSANGVASLEVPSYVTLFETGGTQPPLEPPFEWALSSGNLCYGSGDPAYSWFVSYTGSVEHPGLYPLTLTTTDQFGVCADTTYIAAVGIDLIAPDPLCMGSGDPEFPPDLYPVTVHAGGLPNDQVIVTFPEDTVRVWDNPFRWGEPLDSVITWTIAEGPPPMWLEGIEPDEEGSLIIAELSTSVGGCTTSDQATIHVYGVYQLEFEADVSEGDGKTQIQASALVVPIDNQDDLEWSLLGDPHGAKIDSDTGIITVGTESGELIVEARDPNTDCFAIGRLLVACCECAGECGFGSATPEVGSAAITWKLGRLSDGKPAGVLRYLTTNTNQFAASAENLRFYRKSAGEVYKRYSEFGYYDQIHVPEGLIVITGTVGSLVIKFYDEHFVVFENGEYSLEPGATPSVTWHIDGESPFINGVLHITKVVAGQVVARWRYEQSTNQGNDVWTLETMEPDLDVVRTDIATYTPDRLQRHYEVQDPTFGLIYQQHDDFVTLNNWRVPVQSIVDENGAHLVTSYERYTTAGPAFGRMKSVVLPDGSWSYFTYDSLGRRSFVYTPGKGEPLGGGPGNDARSVEFLYGSNDPLDTLTESPRLPRQIIERVGTVEVGRTYFVTYRDGQNLIEISEQAGAQAAAYGTAGNFRTTVRYRANDDDRIEQIIYPDGRLATATYEYGLAAITYGHPTTVNFTSGAGQDQKVIVTAGTVGSPDGIANKTTRSIIYLNRASKQLYSETLVCTDGSNYAQVGWAAAQLDDLGHVTATYASNGTETHANWDCCDLLDTTDATGVKVEYIRDVLGRARQIKKLGPDPANPYTGAITATYTIDALGIVRGTTISGGGISLSTSAEYDLAGRLIWQTDPATVTTEYDRFASQSSGSSVTVTRGGTYATASYDIGGTLSAITGTGVVPRAYDHGVTAAGETWAKVFIGPNGVTSPLWARSTLDFLGRVKYSERRGFEGNETVGTVYSYYAANVGGMMSLGRPWKVQPYQFASGVPTTPLRAPTIYEYDNIGSNTRVGIDLNATDTLDNNSTDRIEEVTSQFTPIGGSWYVESIKKTYLGGSSTATVLGKSRTKLTGLGSYAAVSETLDYYNNTSTTTVAIDAVNKTVTQTTGYVETSNTAQTIAINGLPISARDKAQLTTIFEYDALGRRTKTKDARNNWSRVNYDPLTGRVASIDNNRGDETFYAYFTSGPDIGRVQSVTNPEGLATYLGYSPLGAIERAWGSAAQPAVITFDAFGRRHKLSTFRKDTVGGNTINWNDSTWPAGVDPLDPAIADITTWAFDDATGLAKTKTYADGSFVSLDYTADGRVSRREWARTAGNPAVPVATDYLYFDDPQSPATFTGQLKKIDYIPTDTPDVEFTYDRLGRPKTVQDALGTRQFTYHASGPLLYEAFTAGALTGKTITTQYSDSVTYPAPFGGTPIKTVFQRLSNIAVSGGMYSANYDYDQNTDYLTQVTGPGLPGSGAQYSYLANTDLVSQIDYKAGSTTIFKQVRTWATDRNLLASIENVWQPSSATVSKYTYQADKLGRRTSALRSGAAFSASNFDLWTYNGRNELEGSLRYIGADPSNPGSATADPDFDRQWRYDPIGNRTSYEEGQADAVNYCTDALNRYQTIAELADCPPTTPLETFGYDADGNLTSDERFTYTWDAENRLTAVQPVSQPVAGDVRLEYVYDYLGRRVEKRVFDWDPLLNGGAGGWEAAPSLHRRWVHFQWQPLVELDALNSNAVLQKYTWGLDLAGRGSHPSIADAGGIGGLLASYDTSGTTSTTDDRSFAFCYDGNGNVGQLVELTSSGNYSGNYGTIAAKYEYDAYGHNLLDITNASQSGAYAATNPFRFSTKPFENATGLGYWGYRWYSPRMGRWLNRDPIEEAGGLNLHTFDLNEPTNRLDPFGDEVRVTAQRPSPCGKYRYVYLATYDCNNNIVATETVTIDPGLGNAGITLKKARDALEEHCNSFGDYVDVGYEVGRDTIVDIVDGAIDVAKDPAAATEGLEAAFDRSVEMFIADGCGSDGAALATLAIAALYLTPTPQVCTMIEGINGDGEFINGRQWARELFESGLLGAGWGVLGRACTAAGKATRIEKVYRFLERIATKADQSPRVKRIGAGKTDRVVGTLKHSYCKTLIERYQRRFPEGLAKGVRCELTYFAGELVRHGFPDGKRLDVVLDELGAVFDFKFGRTGLDCKRIDEIRAATKSDCPIIEVRPKR